MRKIVIARGAPGSGKTSFIEKLGLTDYTVSPDRIRLLLSGPRIGSDGELGLPQQKGGEVWKFAMDNLAARMRAGETVAFDATLPKAKDLQPLLDLAAEHRYEHIIVDFYGVPAEVAKARNAGRDPLRCVPSHAIDRLYAEHQPAPEGANVVDATLDDDALKAVAEFLVVRTIDASSYRQVIFVGDIQGCFAVLMKPESPLAGGLRDDTLYVFTGDFLDRGLENGEVMRWALDTLVGRDNVLILEGNHEDHIVNWALGRPAVSREFVNRTQPQLEAAGITPEMALPLIAMFREAVALAYHDKRILVTHGGLPAWPGLAEGAGSRLHLVPRVQLAVGAGFYSDPIDEAWTRWALDFERHWPNQIELWQVHGHRNSRMLPPIADYRSLNLEQQAEFGGHFACATLDENGFTPIMIRNDIFRSPAEWDAINRAEERKAHGAQAPLAPWVKRGEPGEVPFDAETLAALRAHRHVNERPSESNPGIVALNFSKQAFFSRSWDEISGQARGLFVREDDRTIVARSYVKFFNHGEIEATQDEALERNLVFPVSGFEKPNGFLGITGFDAATGNLLVCSKSTTDGDFAAIFREILEAKLGPAGLEKLLRVLRDQGASATFEVIDPARDPHIEAYEEANVVLLDIVRRAPTFEKMPYGDLVKMGAYLGVDVKRRAFTAENWDTLQKIMRRPASDMSYRFMGKHVEGFVFEDSLINAMGCATPFMFKQKTKWYSFWKQMRSLKDRVATIRGTDRPLGREVEDETAKAFLAFCERQSKGVLDLSIVELRAHFLADPDAVLPDPETGEVIPPPPASVDQGFLKGLDAIAGQLAAGTAKPASVERLVRQALDCPLKRAALLAHAQGESLVATATPETAALLRAA